MIRTEETIDLGSNLGIQGVEYLAQRAEEYSEYERERIALTNEPRINELKIEGTRLTKEARQLDERRSRAEPAGNAGNRRRKQWYYWTAGAILMVAAFFFSIIALGPYRLGWVGDLYCLGIAVVTPFAVEEFLTAWKSEKLLRGTVTAVFAFALIGGSLLAAIRGDLLSGQMQPATAAVTIDGESSSASQPSANNFYQSTASALRMLMLFLALAIDLGAGVAVNRAIEHGNVIVPDPLQHPPQSRGVKSACSVVSHHLAIGAHAEGRHARAKIAWVRQWMATTGSSLFA